MVEDPRSDGELLVAASSEEPDAFATFYRRHIPGLLSFFRRQVGSAELALDLAAETFAAALDGSSRYEPTPDRRGAGCTGSRGTSCTRRSGGEKSKTG